MAVEILPSLKQTHRRFPVARNSPPGRRGRIAGRLWHSPAAGQSTGEDLQAVTVIGPEEDSSVLVNGLQYPLYSALGDIWGIRVDHCNVSFTITNGKFVVTPTDIDDKSYNPFVPISATAIVYEEMHIAGDMFSFMTYSYLPLGGGVLAVNAFFGNAYVGFDKNNGGEAEEYEKLDVTAGNIEFTSILPDIEMIFSLTLEDGQHAEGHYTGLLDFTDRR